MFFDKVKQDRNNGTNVFNKAVNGVLEIETETASGSGFLIDRYGYALTNAHVVTENGIPSKELFVKVADEEISASIVVLGNDSIGVEDLALIRLSRVPTQATPLILGDFNTVKTGEEIYIIGNSKGEGTCITRGIVSDRLRDGMMMTDASTNFGNSGGPVLNENGFVIGIQQSHRIDAVGMKYAIPIDAVKHFLIKKCKYTIYENNTFFFDNSSLKQDTEAEPNGINNTNSTNNGKRTKTLRFCSACGSALSENTSYCVNCGIKISQRTTESQSERKSIFDGMEHKCPKCGESLKAFEAICPTCKFELRGTKTSSAVQDLANKLETAILDREKISIIKNFPVPNTREDIVEFFLWASANFDEVYYSEHLDIEDISDAWLTLIERCYLKATFSPANFSKSEMQSLRERYDEIQRRKNKKTFLKKYNIPIISISIALATFLIIAIINFIINAKIVIGFVENDFIGKSPLYATTYLEDKGFTNIERKVVYISEYDVDDGTIVDIQINGDDSYQSTDKFQKDAAITITYYIKPINIGFAADELLNLNYQIVYEHLERIGFFNIHIQAIESWDENDKTDELKSISINGNNNFTKDELIPKNAEVILIYCICPITVTISADAFKGADYRDVVLQLQNMGFTNIEKVEIPDLITGWITKEFSVEHVSISGLTNFKAGDKFMPDTPIIISYHTFK